MRALVTGAFGFAGRHLIRELLLHGYEVAAFDINPPESFKDGLLCTGDIRDPDAVEKAVADSRPDVCFHLSGISFVPDGWSDVRNVFAVNLSGTLNALEALRARSAATRLLVVSSSEVYGHNPGDRPVREDDPLDPDNPYAISKAAADLVTLSFAQRQGLRAITARPGNHIGPGQSAAFVASSLARQVAAIANGMARPVIETGNLDSKRDFTDVRDVVRAYRLLIEKGRPGRAYNIASGRAVMIRDILDQYCAIADIRPEIRTDPARVRKAEARPVLDIARIGADTGWKPEIPLTATLRDILSDAGLNKPAGSSTTPRRGPRPGPVSK